jgi:hypothetical protein
VQDNAVSEGLIVDEFEEVLFHQDFINQVQQSWLRSFV